MTGSLLCDYEDEIKKGSGAKEDASGPDVQTEDLRASTSEHHERDRGTKGPSDGRGYDS